MTSSIVCDLDFWGHTELIAVQIVPNCTGRFDNHFLAAVSELYHCKRISSEALAEVATTRVALAATTSRSTSRIKTTGHEKAAESKRPDLLWVRHERAIDAVRIDGVGRVYDSAETVIQFAGLPRRWLEWWKLARHRWVHR